MSDSPSPLTPVPPAPMLTLEALAEAHQTLRTSFHITLALLVILSGSLFVFFLREVSLARRQVNELTQVVADYEKTAVPLMDDLRARLQAYAKTHPDFNPVLIKYFGSNGPAGPASLGRAEAVTNPLGPRLPPAR